MSSSALAAEWKPRRLQREEASRPLPRSYFSDLIQALFLHEMDPQGRAVLFTSPGAGVGVSFVCSCIATELAGEGDRVLLADAQTLGMLARGTVEELSNYPERVNLSRLWVLGSKQVATRHTGSQNAPASFATSVLSALREQFTHIVLDAPAISVSDDALNFSASVHGTVIVAQNGVTSKQSIIAARERIVSLGGRVLGSVFNSRTTGHH